MMRARESRATHHFSGAKAMWRAMFLGIGIYMMIAGAECMAVDRGFGGAAPSRRRRRTRSANTVAPESEGRSAGALDPLVPAFQRPLVVCLYSFTIPKRIGGGGK